MTAGPVLRWLFSLGLLLGLMLWLDPGRIAAEIAGLDPAWLAIALLVSLAQTALSAWRWRFTARRLGLELAPRRALADYYLAGFINQIVPGGVVGDAWRAQRHAHLSGLTGPAWRAVILERSSGQFVVVILALLAIVLYAPWRTQLGFGAVAGLAVFCLPVLVGVLLWQRLRRRGGWMAAIGPEVRRALLVRDAWPLQLGSSLLIVLSYLLVFAAAARGIGIELELTRLMIMALPALLAMLIPLSVAGWGLRESAAGAVWLAGGLPAEQGVAASLAYGVLVLLASLPGAVVLAFSPSAKARVHQ